MAKYSLTKKAIEDLSQIWEYTYDFWSEIQADKYYFELLRDCKELSEYPNLGKNYKEINAEIFGYKSARHIIFYRKLSGSEIEITRFLHSGMNLKNRIEE